MTRRVTPTLINPFLYLNDYDFEDVCFRCLTEVEFRSPSYPFVDVLESGFTVCPRGSHDLGVTIGIPRGLPVKYQLWSVGGQGFLFSTVK